MSFSVFTDFIKEAQSMDVGTTTTDTTTLDPQSIQVGQPVYDSTGKEMVVLENDPNTTNVTMMPADQQGQAVPQGVETIEETDLASGYSLQPTTAKKAQYDDFEEGEIDWEDLQSAAIDVQAYIRKRDMKGLAEAADYLNFLILQHVHVSEDMSLGPLSANRFPEFTKVKKQSGYTAIMNDIESYRADGLSDIDILLKLGEKYDRSEVETVLDEARKRGIM